MFVLLLGLVVSTCRCLHAHTCVCFVGYARAVGPSPADLQHQQVGTEAEPTGGPGHPQVLRLDQRQAEVPQLLGRRSVRLRLVTPLCCFAIHFERPPVCQFEPFLEMLESVCQG